MTLAFPLARKYFPCFADLGKERLTTQMSGISLYLPGILLVVIGALLVVYGKVELSAICPFGIEMPKEAAYCSLNSNFNLSLQIGGLVSIVLGIALLVTFLIFFNDRFTARGRTTFRQ